MSKDDLPPLPDRVPAKRRQVEALADLHIAAWLAGESLTPSQRRRLQAEKDRRKTLTAPLALGLLVGREGVTPLQFNAIVTALPTIAATAIHHPGVSSPLHESCKRTGVPVHVHDDGGMWQVVRSADRVVAAPKTETPTFATGDVWDMIRYAKHRNLPVEVVLPSGRINGGASGQLPPNERAGARDSRAPNTKGRAV